MKKYLVNGVEVSFDLYVKQLIESQQKCPSFNQDYETNVDNKEDFGNDINNYVIYGLEQWLYDIKDNTDGFEFNGNLFQMA
jgi:hypothetical protein